MIFLSAQPDNFYFSWQIELQLLNFKNCNIPPDKIHVLLGYDKYKGLQRVFKEVIGRNPGVNFFAYQDLRTTKEYPSSIRLNLIKQHFKLFPELEKEIIFYHDSDILFRALPDFNLLTKGDTWYVSDTRNYINADYIISKGGEQLLIKMCECVNIPLALVLKNNSDAGGAQYLLKNTSYEFWDKVEKDSENLFILLNNFNNLAAEKKYINNKIKRSEYHGIQAWCADMWAVLWNGWLLRNDLKIHKELDFCWPKDVIENWEKTKILHYAGVTKIEANESFFCKTKYVHYPPYDDDFRIVNSSTCSYPVINLINDFRINRNKKRIDLSDVSFLISLRIDSADRLENLQAITKYLDKYFNTNILIAESDIVSKIPIEILPDVCNLFFFKDNNPFFHHTKTNNQLISQAKTPIIAIYDADVVLSVDQIIQSVDLIRKKNAHIVSPYNGTFISVDKLFKIIFSKILDPELLSMNQNKFFITTKRSWGGAVFIQKKSYQKAGCDNENFKSWGPEDIERVKRMKNLGYNVQRVRKPLFHLPHVRKVNSGYSDLKTYAKYMEEYFKVCNMKKELLESYIINWPWQMQ